MPIPVFIQNPSEFERLTEDLNRVEAFAIDTEFDNNHYSYGFNLCLLQIATPDACYLIDPFEIRDLSPLWKVLENPEVEKILHDSGEDMRLFYLHGCSPRNLFDTSIAAKLLHFEKIGLGSILSEVLGVEFNKKKQQSNWLKRPLMPMQLEYAANDVIYLSALRTIFTERLRAQNRWDWFKQSMAFLEKKNYAPKPKSTFLSFKEQKEFHPFDQYILNELYRFRDEQAQRINKPVYQVLPESLIHELLREPSVLDNWLTLKGIHYRLQNEVVADKLKAIYENARRVAEETQLPQVKRQLSRQEAALAQQRATRYNTLRDTTFIPIKRWIEDRYSPLFAPYVLSNETISQLIAGEATLAEIGPPYQQNIIKEAASALGIDISAFA
ncbi:MAG: ribonuclease D [Spirosomataceae bacterium]